MYIIEVFVKWLNKNKRGNKINPSNIFKEGIVFDTDGMQKTEEIDETQNCEHNFMPVDSTGTVLSCTKCGFLIKRKEDLKK